MDIGIIVGIIIAFLSVIVAFIGEGGHLASLLQPTAALIVFGGTVGAIVISFPLNEIKNLPQILKVVFTARKSSKEKYINFFRELTAVTRKEGLLSMESKIDSMEVDNYVKKGLQMVVDGIDPNNIKITLENKLANTSERHEKGIAIFEAAGGFSPTMGIIGTVMGLVHVLSNLSNPDTLGPQIAVAFIATLYGVGVANLLWLPIASRLKTLNEDEEREQELAIEGILLIQEGASPTVVVSRLEAFLNEKDSERIRKRESL